MILWIGARCLNPCCFPLLPDIGLSVGKCVALWLVAICGWFFLFVFPCCPLLLWISPSWLFQCSMFSHVALTLSVGKCVALWLVAICGWWAGWPQFFRGWWQLEIIETVLSQCYLKPPASALLAHCTLNKLKGNTLEVYRKCNRNMKQIHFKLTENASFISMLSQPTSQCATGSLHIDWASSKEIHFKYIGNTIEIRNKCIWNAQKMF